MAKKEPPPSKRPTGRPRGRPKGSKSKATIERETKAKLELETRIQAAAAKKRPTTIADVETIGDAKELIGAPPAKLMKEIGFEFTRVFAGMAAFVQPRGKGDDGKDRNPNADPRLFLEYAKIAMTGAKEFAQYESPKLSAVMVGSATVEEIMVSGGLPDEMDGSLMDAGAGGGTTTIDGTAEPSSPRPDATVGQAPSAGDPADVSPGSGAVIPLTRQA